MNEKVDIRKEYIKIRNEIKNKEAKSIIISEKIEKMEEYKTAKIIALYKSLFSEVDTTELINYSIDTGKIVALPRVENNDLVFYKIDSLNEKFVKSEFGVEEPAENVNNIINKNDIDIIIVPGICFDEKKNRMGFGKGYYDKFLKDINADIFGICFDEQIFKNGIMPKEEHDIKMYKIITDKRIIV